MSEISSDEKSTLLAAAVADAGPMAHVGDVPRYLQAYYRHVTPDELTDASPAQIAAVAAAHAEFAAQRPQGRALVRIRPGGSDSLAPATDVVDIVTDDMPFLVDSITMALATHGLSPRVVVHPQLRV